MPLLRNLILLFVVTIVIFAGAPPATSQPGPPKPVTAEEEAKLAQADALYRRGNELVKAGNFVEAHDRYREAFSLKRSFDIAGNLADMENELGKFRDAAEHAAYSLRIFPPNGNQRSKERTVALLAKVKAEVCTVRVAVVGGGVVGSGGADVFVDGAKIGKAPIGFDVYVEPGERVFRAVVPEQPEASQRRRCAKGEAIEVLLRFDPPSLDAPPGVTTATPPRASTTATIPPAASSASARPHGDVAAWPAIVLGCAAAVGVGTGIGLTIAASIENEDAVDTFQRCGRSATCEAVAQHGVDGANVLQGVGVASFAVGAASLTGMVLVLALRDQDAGPTRVLLTPIVGPSASGLSTVGLTVGGRF